jgi:hypothetical protein
MVRLMPYGGYMALRLTVNLPDALRKLYGTPNALRQQHGIFASLYLSSTEAIWYV